MSKIMRQKMRERDDRIHRSKIAQMKASVDNKPPPSYPHLQQNKKKQQLEEDRLMEVERQNGLLLDKLSKIASRKANTSSSRALQPGEAPPPDRMPSLNGSGRKAELQRIAEENQQLLKRIQARQNGKSTYNREELDREFQQHAEYVKLRQQPDLPLM